MDTKQIKRLEAKTRERRLLWILQEQFSQPLRVAEVLVEIAQTCLVNAREQLRPGQMQVLLVKRGAGRVRALRETATTEVVWTLDSGAEDRAVLREHGRMALRRLRIQRLLSEALEQGALATQEDLAQALQVSVRTIKRDCRHLEEQGIYVPTRGNIQAIGRGQTHKAHIVGRWLLGQTYDQIALHTHHCVASIKRYVQAFVRVVELQRRGFGEAHIAMILQMSVPLVRQYLALYAKHDATECRERLQEQLQRLAQGRKEPPTGKKGAL
jgi:DNA-binding Lrp family transcriptional regulator